MRRGRRRRDRSDGRWPVTTRHESLRNREDESIGVFIRKNMGRRTTVSKPAASRAASISTRERLTWCRPRIAGPWRKLSDSSRCPPGRTTSPMFPIARTKRASSTMWKSTSKAETRSYRRLRVASEGSAMSSRLNSALGNSALSASTAAALRSIPVTSAGAELQPPLDVEARSGAYVEHCRAAERNASAPYCATEDDPPHAIHPGVEAGRRGRGSRRPPARSARRACSSQYCSGSNPSGKRAPARRSCRLSSC